jgi:outer membrane receptor for ferric coprogen and ferric-rhodotorulic acid
MGLASPFDRICKFGHRALLATLLATTAIVAGPGILVGPAMAQDGRVIEFNIPAGPLNRALAAFGSQSATQLSYEASIASGLSSPGVRGAFSREAALNQILQGSGLVYSFAGGRNVVITAPDQSLGEVTPDGASMLGTIVLQGGGVTEGTGSYTTSDMSSATGLPLSIRETPQSVSVVTRQVIEDKKYTSLDQAVKDAPGLAAVQDISDGRWRYTSRGFNVSNIQTDGLAMDPVRDNLPQDDLAIYDRIEIVRGATGLLEGSGYPSAAINMVRKKPFSEPHYSISTSASSFGNARVELDASHPLNHSGSWRGRVVGAFSDGDTYRDYNQQKSTVLYGVIEGDISENTTVSFGASYNKERTDGYSWGGLPTRADGSFFIWDRSKYLGHDWEYSDKKMTSVYFDLEHHFASGWKATFSAKRTQASSELLTSYLSDWSLLNEYTMNNRMYDYDHDNFALNAQISGPIELFGQTHDLTFGVNGRRDDQENSGYRGASYIVDPDTWDPTSIAEPDTSTYTHYYTTKYRQDEIGIYGSGRFRLNDDFTVIAGARVSWFDYSSPTDPSEYSENGKFIPYLGAVYDITDDLSVYASYTSIFRAQSRIDATGGMLPPIDGTNVEFGAKTSIMDGRLSASAALFQVNLTNLPESVSASECQSSSTCYRAGEEVRSRGAELELTGDITDNWRLMAGYTYAKSEYIDGPKKGDRYNAQTYPEHMLKIFSTYRFDGGFEGLTVGGGIRVFSNTFSGGDGYMIKQPGYAVADVMMKYDFDDKTSLQLNVNNLFDKKYYGAISTSTGYGNHLGSPRELRLSLKHTF